MASTPEKESSYLSKNDPHKQWFDKARKEAAGLLSDSEKKTTAKSTPEYRNLGNGYFEEIDKQPQRSSAKDKTGNARNLLRDGEQNQSSDSSQPTHRNSVRGRNKRSSNDKNKGKKGILKKFGPITAITGIIFGGGAFFYAAQSMLPAHLSALYTQATDLQYTAYNLRNTRLMSYMLDGGSQIKIDRFSKRYTHFTSYMQERLEKSGIKVGHLDADGNFEAGQVGIIDNAINKKTVLQYEGKTISAESFQDEFASNPGFRDAYYTAKRGRVGDYFDESADDYFGNWPGTTTRNTMEDFDATADSETRMETFKDIVNEHTTGGGGTINTVHSETDKETGEQTLEKNGDDINTDIIEGVDSTTKARALVNHLAGKVSAVGVPVCSVLRLANIASIAISALQISQSIAYFLSFMEPISQMMYGKTGTSSVNEALNFLTQPATSTVDYIDENGKSVTKTVTGSAIEAAGSKLVFGNTTSPESDYQPYALNSITSAVTRIAVGTGATTAVCSGVMAASAVVSLTKYAVPGGSIVSFAIGAFAQTVGRVIFTGVVAAIVNAIIPRLAKMFTSDIFETYAGIPAGELFTQGAAAANFSLATKGSAYMPASEDQVKTQNRYTTLAIAQEAETDRLHRSPFDASSPNTFLGSILSKFSYLSYSNPLIHGTAGVASAVGSSIRTLIPGAAAADQELSYTSQNSACPNFKGAVCDVYGHPIVGFDYDIIDTKPDDPAYIAAIAPNLNEDGSVKDGSDLARYIVVCSGRQSEWGVPDANIRSALRSDKGISLGDLPIADEITRFIDAAEDAIDAYQGWDTGEACPKPEYKYYRLYTLDNRILRSMDDPNTGEPNPVLAYAQKYRETHPQDNSFEGTLSRISGLSQDDIAFLLEYIDYSTEIANYNPSERLKFGPYREPQTVTLEFTESQTPTIDILSKISEPIFIDRRNYTL